MKSAATEEAISNEDPDGLVAVSRNPGWPGWVLSSPTWVAETSCLTSGNTGLVSGAIGLEGCTESILAYISSSDVGGVARTSGLSLDTPSPEKKAEADVSRRGGRVTGFPGRLLVQSEYSKGAFWFKSPISGRVLSGRPDTTNPQASNAAPESTESLMAMTEKKWSFEGSNQGMCEKF